MAQTRKLRTPGLKVTGSRPRQNLLGCSGTGQTWSFVFCRHRLVSANVLGCKRLGHPGLLWSRWVMDPRAPGCPSLSCWLCPSQNHSCCPNMVLTVLCLPKSPVHQPLHTQSNGMWTFTSPMLWVRNQGIERLRNLLNSCNWLAEGRM